MRDDDPCRECGHPMGGHGVLGCAVGWAWDVELGGQTATAADPCECSRCAP